MAICSYFIGWHPARVLATPGGIRVIAREHPRWRYVYAGGVPGSPHDVITSDIPRDVISFSVCDWRMRMT